MLRRFLFLSGGALAFLMVVGTPGQLQAQHRHMGFSRGFTPGFNRSSTPGFSRGFFNPGFSPGFTPGFLSPFCWRLSQDDAGVMIEPSLRPAAGWSRHLLLSAAAVALIVLFPAGWLYRTRSAKRWKAALDAYAAREIARERDRKDLPW